MQRSHTTKYNQARIRFFSISTCCHPKKLSYLKHSVVNEIPSKITHGQKREWMKTICLCWTHHTHGIVNRFPRALRNMQIVCLLLLVYAVAKWLLATGPLRLNDVLNGWKWWKQTWKTLLLLCGSFPFWDRCLIVYVVLLFSRRHPCRKRAEAQKQKIPAIHT